MKAVDLLADARIAALAVESQDLTLRIRSHFPVSFGQGE
jgi:hypothetical protein